ncbi:MAG TPA: methylmalonyl-CoA mutase family protein, partial [Caulobacter sp.]|nr:methylmalonyl-CoA mutase family protein [Caulobacter sp.]
MTDKPFQHAPDAPWIFRTYAGHSTAEKSNALYRRNLAAGQTGLSVAFDLPTQTGYDADHILARGEVGKVGVPVGHLGDMRALFDGIPLDRMNTSMTINAPAAWLLAMYVALADEQGAPRSALQGTTQNDLIKEYLSRGTYIFPPEPSLRLIGDMIAWCYREVPRWNPMNVCSYHLQEAGATPEQELAYALATAISVLDTVRAGGQVPDEDFEIVCSRISFFVNAGVRFVTELCKMRAFTALWDEILRDRYGVKDAKARRFRYGVQVNSLGLTEQQPENNPYRILLEALAVTLSKDARCRALQLPAWNEALGLPRPWDQQWSLRMQQVLAYETDLLEYEDLFAGSHVVEAKVAELKAGALSELARIDGIGGAAAAIDYMKAELVGSNAARVRAVETGGMTVVGVNRWTDTEQSPLSAGEGSIETVDPKLEAGVVERLKAWRAARDNAAVEAALADLKAAARDGRNIMEPSIVAAKAGVTTGEWAFALREVFGEYRGPTGVAVVVASGDDAEDIEAVRKDVERVSEVLGRTLTYLIGKPGLDGHSNGAEQIATRARAVGMEVHYDGIRSTPDEIVRRAKETKAHVVGLSILSGSHLDLVQEVVRVMRAEGLGDVPVVVGGIIPPD